MLIAMLHALIGYMLRVNVLSREGAESRQAIGFHEAEAGVTQAIPCCEVMAGKCHTYTKPTSFG